MRCIKRLLHAKYRMTVPELVGILKSCLSMSAGVKAPPEKGLLHHIWAIISWGKHSFVIKHGLVVLL